MPLTSAQRNKRALCIGAVAIVAVLAFHFLIYPWLDHWGDVRVSLKLQTEKLALIDHSSDEAAAVRSFALPQSEDKQRLLFERKLNEQLQQAKIKVTSLPQYLAKGKSQPALDLKLLRLQCRATCTFPQALDLLALLDQNPYLVAIEELKLQCGKKKREQMELALTVSTFVR